MREHKQTRLLLDPESDLECLWDAFPDTSKECVMQHYLHLITASIRAQRTDKEGSRKHDQDNGR
jgi:hypothetical protein